MSGDIGALRAWKIERGRGPRRFCTGTGDTMHTSLSRTRGTLRNRQRARLLAAVAVTVGIIGALAAPLAASADTSCKGVAIFAFRGTDEGKVATKYPGALTTNGWEGERLSRLLDGYARVPAYSDGFRTDQVDVIGIGYDAATGKGYRADGIQKHLDEGHPERIPDAVGESSRTGETAGLQAIADYIGERPLGCRTSIILAGYSQGAMATHTIAAAMESNSGGTLSPRVSFVYNVGDPYQSKDGIGNAGTGSKGTGFYRMGMAGDAARQTDKFYDIAGGKHSYCHKGDPFCDYNWAGPGLVSMWRGPTQHTNYFLDAAERDSEAKVLADAAHAAWQASKTSTPPTKRSAVDTMLVIDTTGSMSPYIAQAVASAREIAQKTLASATNGRVGLVEYRDHGDSVVSRVVVPLTKDVGAFSSGLDELYASGGGDWPEAVYSGIVRALGVDWSPAASRSVVVLGDAPPHDPEPVTGFTAPQVAKMLLGKGVVPVLASPASRVARREPTPLDTAADVQEANAGPEDVSVVPDEAGNARVAPVAESEGEGTGLPVTLYALSAAPELADALAPIAHETGGTITDLGTPDEVGDAIIASIDDAATAPEAILSVLGAATAGAPVVISATGSTSIDAVPTYEFDLDGDAVFETPSADGIVSHTFTAAGENTIGLRVTDSRGRAAVTTTTVNVSDSAGYLDPSDPASNVPVTVQPTAVRAGQTISVSSDAFTAGEMVSLRLVRSSEAQPWFVEPESVLAPVAVPNASGTVTFSLGASVPAADYTVLVVTDTNRHGQGTLRVTAAAAPGPARETPAPSSSTAAPSGAAGGSKGTGSHLARTGGQWSPVALLIAGVFLASGVAASFAADRAGRRRRATKD